ncbi:unnamed protein product, partial [Notodromas monacha]
MGCACSCPPPCACSGAPVPEPEIPQLPVDLYDPRTLYEDKDFPATSASLYTSSEKREEIGKLNISWKRPKEISENPHLLVDGISGGDVKQGSLGDCWFLAGCASIAFDKKLMGMVIRNNVDLASDEYDGMLTITFWWYGKWRTVTIDDRLPYLEMGDEKRLLFARCVQPDEFWLPIVEKAYAK